MVGWSALWKNQEEATVMVSEKSESPAASTIAQSSRIRSLEGQVTAIQSTLTDLVSTLRAGMAAPPPPPPPPPLPLHPVDFSLFTSNQNFGFPPKQEILIAPRFDGSEPGSTPSYRSQASPYVPLDAFKHIGGMPGLPVDFLRAAPSVPLQSLPPSRLGSPGADQDILAPEEITNPLGALSNMAGLVEAAVERAREEGTPLKRPMEAVPDMPYKKARFDHDEPLGPTITETQNLAPSGSRKGKGKRTHIHAYPDAVSEGYISEDEGKELLQMSVNSVFGR